MFPRSNLLGASLRATKRVVLALDELAGERQEAHARLELNHRVRRFRSPGMDATKLNGASHRRQVFERAELEQALAHFLPSLLNVQNSVV